METREWTRFGVIHCSATKPDQDVDIWDIDSWHRARGIYQRGAPSGYHSVGLRRGGIQFGRRRLQVGAHVRGFNYESISHCMVGGLDADGEPAPIYTERQWEDLREVVHGWIGQWPEIQILGHNQINPGKACPSFNVRFWLEKEGLSAHAWGGKK